MSEQTKVALVTGAGHGIGRAIALRLARDGLSIAVHYASSRESALDVVEEIKGLGVEAAAVQADIGRISEVTALFDAVDNEFSRLDALVNCAGIVKPSPLVTMTEETFDEIFSVNVKGSAFAAREAANRIAEGGTIVNISSSRTHFPAAGTTCYAGSKAALEMFTAIWAQELAQKGITVNAVAPGPTSPGMFDRAPEFMKSAAVKSSPFARIGSADEVADVVAFLCSENAKWVTGQVVLVNGGGGI